MTTTTIYTDAVLTAPEALAAIARAAGSTVLQPGTPEAHVPLSGGSVARIEVAKFGDESPVAIDVTGDDADTAASAATTLAAALAAASSGPGPRITIVGIRGS